MSNDVEKELREALLAEDELGTVVRSHLYIESLLDELLDLLLPSPQHLEDMNLSYGNKVRLVCAAGLDPEFKPMLLALGTIRNRFSHDLRAKIDASMVRELHSKLHHKARNGVPRAMAHIGGLDANVSFQKLHPRDQFTGLVLTLWVVMSGAVEEVRECADPE